jgi:SAM-dependent methyltransferase
MDDFLESRRSRMRWNTPLSEAHARLLLDRMDFRNGGRIADLGCGWGELLLRALVRAPGTLGTGVDSDPVALERGRALAQARGLEGRVEFVEADAGEWRGTAERALCVGSSHAFGGSSAALAALKEIVPRGGRLLYGDGCWPTPPTEETEAIFGVDILSLPDLVAAADEAGWRVIHLSTADQLEWDDFESTSRAGRQEWLLAHPDDPRAEEVREWLDTRQRQYVQDYRGVLGFAYLVLAR